jgi:alpha-beta hydrolase superfamily lysophospholipase
MLEYIRQHPILKHTRLVAYGQSLGGAAAIHLVSQNEDKFSALIIENTFLSVVSCIPFYISFIRICLFIYLYFD